MGAGQTFRGTSLLQNSELLASACAQSTEAKQLKRLHSFCRAGLHRFGLQLCGYACTEYGVGMVTWALFAAAYVLELNHYCPRRTWLLRFPVLFIFAGELAKARCPPMLPMRTPFSDADVMTAPGGCCVWCL